MFRDTKEELKRLQDQLLADDETKVLPKLGRQDLDKTRVIPDLSRMVKESHGDLEDVAEFLDMDEEELEQLLAPIPGEEVPEEPVYRNFSNGYGTQVPRVYNSDRVDENIDIYSDESDSFYEEPQKNQSVKGLIITALCLLAGIVGVLLWWVVHYF